MFVVNIGGCDTMLGVDWLWTLGKITMDFKEFYMIFVKESHTHTLKGLQVGPLIVIISHRMEKLLKKGHSGVIFQLHTIQELDDDPHEIPPDQQ